MLDKGVCDTGFFWNPSNCDSERDKSCDRRQYLDYESCRCRKKLIDKLVEKCNKNIDASKMIHNDYRNVCNSCTIYIESFAITFLIIIGISSEFTYFHWYLKKSNTNITNINANTETVIY